MEKKAYYLDTCIWLNLFKREGDASKGLQWWEITAKFVAYAKHTHGIGIIVVSTIVMKELRHKLPDQYDAIRRYFERKKCIQIISTRNEDYMLARMFESCHKSLSFYDYLHIAISKIRGFILITRDKDLLAFAQKHVSAFRPEDVLNSY